jgi:putative cell wall-binding protein
MSRRLLLVAAVLAASVAAIATAGPASSTPDLDRLSGSDRYATAAAVSAATFAAGTVDAAYVATGEGYADALAGGPAARRFGGPVLLSQRDTVPAVLAEELLRLKPKRIVVLGGPSAVAESVVTELGRFASAGVSRHAGSDRYATAALVASNAYSGPIPTAYVASGESYPDALSGSAVAAASGSPILLTSRDLLPDVTKSALRTLDPENVVILGGRSAVSGAVEEQLATFARAGVPRFSGDDRFDTSAAISWSSFSRPRSTVYVTTGLDFPDGLTAGAAAGKTNAPVLLVRPDCMPEPVKAELDLLQPERVIVVGGRNAVSDAAATGAAVCLPRFPNTPPAPQYGPADKVTAAFYYGWYPGNWYAMNPHYAPDIGKYDSLDAEVVRRHIEQMRYSGMNAAIASWWGIGHGTDRALPVDLRESEGTPFAWGAYYELEGPGLPNKSPSEIRADLDYLWRYTSHPNWLHRNGKPVVFVWPDDNDACDMAQRWADANQGQWYVVQKRFPGWTGCQHLADSWHEYGPGAKHFDVRPFSFVVSPGFWRHDLEAPWLVRDPARFDESVRLMKESGAPWQLVTTFNEWVEGTSVEPSPEWGTTYLDILHRHYGYR